jgi:hypothetical protein
MGQPLVSDHQPTEVAQPGIGAFDLPPLLVAREVWLPAKPGSPAPPEGNMVERAADGDAEAEAWLDAYDALQATRYKPLEE